MIFQLSFPEAKNIVVCGDIHGEFNEVIFKLCVQYQLNDTLLIVAGDCGFGFERRGYYEEMVKRNSKRMSNSNNWIVFVRGNHDNPAYFDGKTIRYKRFIAVPDYSIIQACAHTILCVGGAISIDRQIRIHSWQKKLVRERLFASSKEDDTFAPNYYWIDEPPVLDIEILTQIGKEFRVDAVVTHTAPSFCELQAKSGLSSWCLVDDKLMEDINEERATMDKLHRQLNAAKHPLSYWYYGHFHQSRSSKIANILFRMLDIMEFHLLR